MELEDMRIAINDAPLWCEECDKPIIGTGIGTYGVLRDAIEEHYQRRHRLVGECTSGLINDGGGGC